MFTKMNRSDDGLFFYAKITTIEQARINKIISSRFTGSCGKRPEPQDFRPLEKAGMGKKKGFDFIEDLHERANHNINPYYWFNRVTPFTLAQWRTNKYFAPIFFFVYSAGGTLWLNSLNQAALAENKTFWEFIFDFGDSFTSTRFVGILLFSIYWVITAIATTQVIVQRIQASPSTSQPERRKEKKKKYPKRPKNWE